MRDPSFVRESSRGDAMAREFIVIYTALTDLRTFSNGLVSSTSLCNEKHFSFTILDRYIVVCCVWSHYNNT